MSENNVNGIIGAEVTTTGIVGATVAIGQYIINDYVITIAEAEGDYGYTMTITRGTDTQTVTLYGLTPEQYNAMLGYLEQAQAAAQSAAGSANDAADYMGVALDAANRANTQAGRAEQASNTARSYASQAQTAKQGAETAKTDAQTARTQAQGYRQAAEAAATRAETAATRAETSAEEITGMTAEAETLEPGSPATASFLDGVLSLGIPAGANGAAGNGIVSIVKTGTSGNVDTYTITYTNGTTSTFTVRNGVDGAVTSVAGKTGAVTLDAGDVAFDDQETYNNGTVGAGLTNLKSQMSAVDDEVFTTSQSTVSVPLSYTVDGFYTSNGTFYSHSTIKCAPVSVSQGEQYQVHANSVWDAVCYSIFDNNGNILQYGDKSGSSTSKYYTYDLTMPTDAAIMYITAGSLSAQTADWVKKIVDEKTSRIDPLVWPLNGVKWGAIGDSFTSADTLSQQTDTHNYVDYITEQTGITVINYGSSGTGYKRGEDNNNAFYQRALNVASDCDVITIFGSGNDQTYSSLADVGEATDTGTTTLGGCVNTTIDNLLSVNPLVRIGIVAPTPWRGYPPDSTSATWMRRYTNLLKNVCALRGIPFLDLYHESNLRPWDNAVLSALYIDNTHPNAEGHKRIASMFKAFLMRIVG